MARLDQERQKRLEPQRIKGTKKELQQMGFEIIREDTTKLQFMFKDEVITFFPYSGWHTGKNNKRRKRMEEVKTTIGTMNRYSIPGKPDSFRVYNFSLIKHMFECEKKFELAIHNKLELDSSAINYGKIFERILLGDWDEQLPNLSPKSGKIRTAIKQCADYVAKEYFKRECGDFTNNEAQHIEVTDLGEYGYGGAYDYFGEYTTTQQEENKTYELAIVDLKFTMNIDFSMYGVNEEIGNIYNHLQPISYTWLHWRRTGNIIPFIRLVIEGRLAPKPIVKETLFIPTLKVFKWFEKQLNMIHKSVELSAFGDVFTETEDIEKCFHRKMSCQYLHLCPIGRERRFKHIGPSEIKLEQLI